MLRWRSGSSQIQAWTSLRADRWRQTGECPDGQVGGGQRDRSLPQSWTKGVFRLACSTTQEIFSPDLWVQHIRGSVRDQDSGWWTSSSVLDSPGRVLQVRVDLVVPVTVRQLVRGGDVMADLLSISAPAHSDHFGVEVVDAADQHGGVSPSRGDHRVDHHLRSHWNQKVGQSTENYCTNKRKNKNVCLK